MDSWGASREVEKVKKPTQLERHQQLRHDVRHTQARLGELDQALEQFRTGPNRSRASETLILVSKLFDRLVGELRGER